jgi:mono/diheme cytochrome c family protein
VPQEELEDILHKGRKDTLMPAFTMENGGPLTRAQVQVLVMEIKGLPYKLVEKQETDAARFEVLPDAGGIAPSWGTPAKPPRDVPPYRASGVARSPAHAEKGAAVYARACAVCHGSNGQGIAKAGEMIRTINDRVFLALLSNQALRRYAITGRPDLGMPSFDAARPDNPHFVPLTDQEVTDLVALLASWRGDN